MQENDSGEGEANNKRRKLELDSILFNPFIDDDWSYGGDCGSSAVEVDHQEEEVVYLFNSFFNSSFLYINHFVLVASI